MGVFAHLVEDLQHVKVAIGVKLIPCVVRGDGHRDARSLSFVQQGDAPPARGASSLGVSILGPLVH